MTTPTAAPRVSEPRVPEHRMPGDIMSLTARWRLVADAVPDAVALVGSSTLTYAELDAASGQVAAGLAATGGDPSTPVGVLLPHDVPLLVAGLGVLRADRIVVSLDPHLPAARLRDIVQLAGITQIVTGAATSPLAAELGDDLVLLRIEDLRAGEPVQAPVALRGGHEAAFIVFTSGSTGRPKGVVQSHDQLLNDVFTADGIFGQSDCDRIGLVLPFGFPIGLIVAMAGLMQGAALHLFDPRDHTPRAAIEWITGHELTLLVCTPHLLRALTDTLGPDEQLPSMRALSTVGEAVTGKDVVAIRPHLAADALFVNWMGSSEIGALAHFAIPAGSPVPDGIMPTGVVAPNKEMRIVDESGEQVPRGETGSILAVSHFLSGGYWRDERANERFGTTDDGRISYVQGDLGRIDDHGNLILLGRADFAVKIRGYLVEPSEVEHALTALDTVAEAFVQPDPGHAGPPRLVAYVAQKATARAESPAALRRALRETLPEYMVPGVIQLLPALPRNERGKVDRAALPAVTRAAPTDEILTHTKALVAEIWETVLGLDQLGSEDDFMALGGDSLAAEEMLAELEDRSGVRLSAADLLAAPTVETFATLVEQHLGESALPRHPDMVPLRTGVGGRPIFGFAGSGALALTLLGLSRRFPDRDMYAFQQHGLERRGIPDRTVEATAVRYLELMRIVQPRGPYVLVGHSFGGLVAMEIARRLQAAGESVELLAVIDTYLPRETAANLPTFVRLTEDDPRRTRAGAVRAAVERRIRRFPTVTRVRQRVRTELAGVVPHLGQEQFDTMFQHGVLSWRRYVPTPYDGRVLMILGDQNPDGEAPWHQVFTGDCEFHDFPAEHNTLLREPVIGQVADLIRHRLSA